MLGEVVYCRLPPGRQRNSMNKVAPSWLASRSPSTVSSKPGAAFSACSSSGSRSKGSRSSTIPTPAFSCCAPTQRPRRCSPRRTFSYPSVLRGVHMYFFCMRAPKFPLRSERPFEEIARAWSAALLWKALHLRMVGYIGAPPPTSGWQG